MCVFPDLGFARSSQVLKTEEPEVCLIRPKERVCLTAERKQFTGNLLSMPQNNNTNNSLGSCIYNNLLFAATSGRVVTNIFEAVATLEKTPDDVMMVLFPGAPDVTSQISATLLKAYCRENDVAAAELKGLDWEPELQALHIHSNYHCILVLKSFPMSPNEFETLKKCQEAGQLSPLPAVSLPCR